MFEIGTNPTIKKSKNKKTIKRDEVLCVVRSLPKGFGVLSFGVRCVCVCCLFSLFLCLLSSFHQDSEHKHVWC